MHLIQRSLLTSTFCLIMSTTVNASTPTEGSATAYLPPVAIKNINAAGTGCPNHQISSSVTSDGKSIELKFQEYMAAVGSFLPRTEKRKVCTANLILDIPEGLAVSIKEVNTNGYTSLDRNVESTQKTTYFFAGTRKEATLQTHFKGPIAKQFTSKSHLDKNSMVWSACNAPQPLVITTEILVDNQRARRESGLISVGGQQSHRYTLAFKKC